MIECIVVGVRGGLDEGDWKGADGKLELLNAEDGAHLGGNFLKLLTAAATEEGAFDNWVKAHTSMQIFEKEVSERSERALRKTRAMELAKWLQTATSTTKLTYPIRLARSVCFARPSLKMRSTNSSSLCFWPWEKNSTQLRPGTSWH